MSKTPDTPMISPKGKAKIAVKPPNEDKYRKEIEEVRAEQRKAAEEIRKLTEEMNMQREKTRGRFSERDSLQQKLRDIGGQLMEIDKIREQLYGQIAAKEQQKIDMMQQAQDMRKNLNVMDESEISAKIYALESAMMARSMSVNEEKKLVQQIQALKKKREMLSRFADMDRAAESHERDRIAPIRAEYEKQRTAYSTLLKEKQDLQVQISKVIKGQEQANAPIRELYEKREEFRAIQADATKKIAELNRSLLAERAEYKAYRERVDTDLAKQRADAQSKRQKEEIRESLQQKLDDLEDSGPPYEMQRLSQCIHYLKKLMGCDQREATPDTTNTTSSPAPSRISDEDGALLVPKNQREEVYYFAPTKSAKAKKKKVPQRQSTQKITHDLQAIADFKELDAALPLRLDQCGACLQELEERYRGWVKDCEDKKAKLAARRAQLMEQLAALDRTNEVVSSKDDQSPQPVTAVSA